MSGCSTVLLALIQVIRLGLLLELSLKWQPPGIMLLPNSDQGNEKTHFQTFLKAAFKLLFQIHILIMALILYPDCVEMESNDRTAT